MNRLVWIFGFALLFAASLAWAQNQAVDPHLQKAKELRAHAGTAFDSGQYDTAADLARQAKAELGLIAARPAASAAAGILPATYTVRLIPGDRDCLWRIAGYPFVYNDPVKWRELYNANKEKLREPENPDLINPGLVLVIPSIAGESRSGEWDPSGSYSTFGPGEN